MSNTSGDRSEFDFWEFVSCSKCRMPFALDNGLATIPFWLTECGHVICNNHLSLSSIISLYRFVDFEQGGVLVNARSWSELLSMRNARHPSSTSPTTGSLAWITGAVSHNYQMDPPMSEWFQSIPRSLDSIAYAAKVHDNFLSLCLSWSQGLRLRFVCSFSWMWWCHRSYTTDRSTNSYANSWSGLNGMLLSWRSTIISIAQNLQESTYFYFDHRSNDNLQKENDQHRLRLGHHNTDSSLNSNGKRPMVSLS